MAAKPEKKKDIKKSILLRVRVLYILFFTVGIAIAAKILYIQYGPNGEELRQRAVKISYERAVIEADRGDILACDGRILATSVPTYEIRMDFAAQGMTDSIFNRNVDSLAIRLSTYFGDKSTGAYKSLLKNSYANKKKNRYTLISPRRVNHLAIKEIAEFPLFRLGANRGGFIPVQINRRLRPHGSMAARTIGMTNETGTKIGIEGAFDSVLRGTDGNILMQKISGNFRIPVQDELSVSPIDGIDVVTTIDVEIQDVAESALKRQLIDGEADWGTAVLMDVETGQIRAITNLTRKSDATVVEDFNYAIGMNNEPGSTFKLATLITLLDDAGASINERFDTGNGKRIINRAKVEDTHAYGELTLSGIFEKSSNVGFALATNKYYKDNPARFVDHICKMGLDKSLHLQIEGGKKPVIRHPGERWWDGTTLTMMSYGYALEVTPLRTLTLYNAIANKGKMVAPLFVTELQQYGQSLRRYPTEVIADKIVSDETLKIVQEAMKGVVDEGTARILKNPYYTVAAKTGTAQIAQGRSGYTDRFGGRHYLATLVGYFPADNPKYSCIVAIKTYNGPGRRSTYYGASLAGPVFRAVADRVYARSTGWQKSVAEQREKTTETPHIKLGKTEEVARVANRFKSKTDIPHKAEWITENITKTEQDSVISSITEIGSITGTVPSVIGMGLKEALFLLEREGLIVTFQGRGTVMRQSLKAGSLISKGAIISLQTGDTDHVTDN